MTLGVRTTPGLLKRPRKKIRPAGRSVWQATSADAASQSEAYAAAAGSPVHPTLSWASTILSQATLWRAGYNSEPLYLLSRYSLSALCQHCDRVGGRLA